MHRGDSLRHTNVLERVLFRQHPSMSFSPVQSIYHHFVTSVSGPELFALPKQLLTPTQLREQPQHLPPCSANTPVSPKPPTSGTPALQTPPQHIARASYHHSLQYFTQGYATACMDKSSDPGNIISEWDGKGTPTVISAMTVFLCPCTSWRCYGLMRTCHHPLGSASASSRHGRPTPWGS